MPNLEEVYARIKENKKKKKELGQMLKDELDASQRFQEIKEQMTELRDEKKRIENDIRAETPDFAELDDLKEDIKTDQEVLTDITLNMFLNNEKVEIEDEHGDQWVPSFKVTFKKVN